ncbi:MAG: hypothetical protein RL226_757 [Bacteroidota bacterium]
MAAVHIVIGVLCFYVFDDRWYFIAAQLFIGASFYISVRFFYLFDRQYRHLLNAMADFHAQDTGSRLRPTGNKDIDPLIEKYNQLIANIQEEQLRLAGQGQIVEELIARSHVGVIITDVDGRIAEANQAAATFLNTTPSVMLGQFISTYRLDERSENTTLNLHNRRLKTSLSKVKYKGFYRQFMLIEDLTSELLQSEKEAYGRVIRMMSHEVNNATGAVNSILQTLADSPEAADPTFAEAIQIARERNQSLGQFVSNFASVIRVYEPQKQPVSLGELAEKVVKVSSFAAKERHIQLHVENLSPVGATVFIDPVQIEQLLINVVKNALESIHEHGNVTLRIDASGKQIMVEDDGPGLSQQTGQQLDAGLFYSTKPHGQGIGLMLSREILRLHGTSYTLQTDADGLTRFIVRF